MGFLYSLPVSDSCFNSINIDFISPLPTDKEYDILIMIINQLGLANICYCEKRLFLEIITNCNQLFVSKSWKKLYK